MAIKIYEKFAPRANPADGDYPYGSIKNESVPGAKDGTPLDAVWANDYAGTDAELFAQAGIVPNGQPDKLGASQRVDAMRKIFSNVGTVADVADGKFKVGARVSVADRSNGLFVIVAGGVANGFDILDAGLGNTAQLETGMVINPAHFGVNNSASDYLAIQRVYDYVADHAIVDASGLDIRMDGLVTIQDKNGVTTKGGSWHWNHQGSNMIKLLGVLESPTFTAMNVRGNNAPFSSQGAIGCQSGTITTNWLVDSCHFNQVPFGVYINADLSGLHTNPHVTKCTFMDLPRFAADSASGSGLGVVFANGGGAIKNGKSSFNTFTRCGRHALYISDGGNVTSAFDTFLEHRNDGSPLITELAAMQITRRANNVNVVCPVFIESRDLSMAVQAVQTSGASTYGKGVSVISPKFIDGYAVDMKIGNDSPSVNGFIDDVTVSDVYIKQSGTNQSNRIQLFSGRRLRVLGVNVESDNSAGAQNLVNIVNILGNATVSEFDDIVVRDIRGSISGTVSRGVAVADNILIGTHKLTLEDIAAGTTQIYQGISVSPTNPNYMKIIGNKPVVFSAFTASFTNQNSEINRVDKYAGKKMMSLSGGLIKPLFATGSSPTATWVDGAGTIVHTPT